ncbi:MAG: bacillithiol biosynthesis deacetylase BshB1 [Bacteroidia bacterium]
MTKLDVLVFAAHPDDAEMSCGGTIAKLISQGKKVGIIDLTRGELGTRGTPELRAKEAAAAAKVLNLTIRENLGMRDAFFRNDEAHQLQIIQCIRRYQPEIILANALRDRHPDHGKGADLLRDAWFLSGLKNIPTLDEMGETQSAWRAPKLFNYIQDQHLTPDFVVDISDFFAQKMDAIRCFASQFYNENSNEPETYISTKTFWEFFEARNRNTGHIINVTYGEGFLSETPLKINNILDLA